jgi:hypothetical protein
LVVEVAVEMVTVQVAAVPAVTGTGLLEQKATDAKLLNVVEVVLAVSWMFPEKPPAALMVTVAVPLLPLEKLRAVGATVRVIVGLVTVMDSVLEVEPAKGPAGLVAVPPPWKTAVMESVPTGRRAVVAVIGRVAVPVFPAVPGTTVAVPRAVLPALKTTVPPSVPETVEWTVAVRVRALPEATEGALEVRVVVVAAEPIGVVIVSTTEPVEPK